MIDDNLQGLDGLTVGILGFGVTGVAVAAAFQKRGCLIFYYDPAARDPRTAEAVGAKPCSLDDLFQLADVVSLHVPLLPQTTGMIGRRELAMMKDGAVLIQGSRGGVVDEAALAEALQSGKLGGAAGGVFSPKPPLAGNHLLAFKDEEAHPILFCAPI